MPQDGHGPVIYRYMALKSSFLQVEIDAGMKELVDQVIALVEILIR